MACGSGECGKSAQGHDICRCEDGVEGATCDYGKATGQLDYFDAFKEKTVTNIVKHLLYPITIKKPMIM